MSRRSQITVIIGRVAIELAVDGAVWVISRVFDAATREPITNFERPSRIYDPSSGRSFRLLSSGKYELVDGPIAL